MKNKRITPKEAGSLEMWLVMIVIGGAFIIAALNGQLVMTIVIMFIGVGVFLGMILLLHSKYSQLSKQSQAKILERQFEMEADSHGEKWCVYWIVFQFTTGETLVTLRARVTRSFYERVEPGATLAVRYHATDPRIAQLEGEDGFN